MAACFLLSYRRSLRPLIKDWSVRQWKSQPNRKVGIVGKGRVTEYTHCLRVANGSVASKEGSKSEGEIDKGSRGGAVGPMRSSRGAGGRCLRVDGRSPLGRLTSANHPDSATETAAFQRGPFPQQHCTHIKGRNGPSDGLIVPPQLRN